MAFKMKGFSAFTKKTSAPNDPPAKSSDEKADKISQMHRELEKLEKKQKEGTITKNEEKKLQEIGNYLDNYYGDDNRG
tara:strand:+ start:787 stop:1020 length:234 start_codon:yes stop_codon:yes gene_type:complete